MNDTLQRDTPTEIETKRTLRRWLFRAALAAFAAALAGFWWTHGKYYADIGNHFKYASIGPTIRSAVFRGTCGKLCPSCSRNTSRTMRTPPPISAGERVMLNSAFCSKPIASCRSASRNALSWVWNWWDSITPSATPGAVASLPGPMRSWCWGCRPTLSICRATSGFSSTVPRIALHGRSCHGSFEQPSEPLRAALLPASYPGLSGQRPRNERSSITGKRSPHFGPGRVDTFTPYKRLYFDLPAGQHVGTADFPSLWNQRPRIGMNLHWDGNNTSVEERNLSMPWGLGSSPRLWTSVPKIESLNGSWTSALRHILNPSTRHWRRMAERSTAGTVPTAMVARQLTDSRMTRWAT